MTDLKILFSGILLICLALSIAHPSSHHEELPDPILAPSAGFTLTAQPVNVTVDTSVTANATVLVHATGGGVRVELSLTQYNEDLTCTGLSPSSVVVPPDVNATFSCSSTTANAYPVTVVGKNPLQPTLTSSVQVNLIFTSSSSSSGTDSASTLPFQGPITQSYLEAGAAVAAFAVVGLIVYELRKRNTPTKKQT